MTRTALSLLLLVLAVPQTPAEPKPSEPQAVSALPLHEKLKVFEPLLGNTYRGEFADSTPAMPKFDVSKWERAMNGQAVRILHSVNDGVYGGETILMWDKKTEKITYWYFTTSGFHTEGTMDVNGNEWSSTEKVTGESSGITEVKSTSTLDQKGNLKTSAKYLQNGKWIPGHEVEYIPSPEAKVVFR
jgi:hypothetical protein